MNETMTVCPACRREVTVLGNRYSTHNSAPTVGYCFMSGMPEPVTGRSDDDMERRAKTVAYLAMLMQDGDPTVVWKYLGILSRQSLMELMQIALAGMDVEGKRVAEIWERWTTE